MAQRRYIGGSYGCHAVLVEGGEAFSCGWRVGRNVFVDSVRVKASCSSATGGVVDVYVGVGPAIAGAVNAGEIAKLRESFVNHLLSDGGPYLDLGSTGFHIQTGQSLDLVVPVNRFFTTPDCLSVIFNTVAVDVMFFAAIKAERRSGRGA